MGNSLLSFHHEVYGGRLAIYNQKYRGRTNNTISNNFIGKNCKMAKSSKFDLHNAYTSYDDIWMSSLVGGIQNVGS